MNIKIIVSTLWCKKYYVPTVYIVIIGENVDYIYKYAFSIGTCSIHYHYHKL